MPIGRGNYRLAIYKQANQPRFWQPKPCYDGQQWVKNEDGFLEPVWLCSQARIAPGQGQGNTSEEAPEEPQVSEGFQTTCR